jgi:hypothetical protein
MTTSTNVVEVSDAAYVNASNGNINLALFVKFNQKLRIVVQDSLDEPLPNAGNYVVVSGGADEFSGARLIMSFHNLEGGSDVWIRAEKGEDTVTVIRGPTTVVGNR